MATLLLFSSIKEKLETDSINIQSNVKTITELRDWLVAGHPIIKDELTNVIWAKNEEYVELDTPIFPGDEIAIITPVSGG